MHHVTLRADKTKLLVLSNNSTDLLAYHATFVSSVKVNFDLLEFMEVEEHVGLGKFSKLKSRETLDGSK